jgi:biopolymer transport protein ExbD
MNNKETTIPLLTQELEYQANRAKAANPTEKFAGEVTIMGDRKIPYQLLKKIMVTCARASYTKLSLAVNQAGSGNT